MFWLKVILTPLVVAAVTMIGRRYGPRAAGLVVGLPLTTGPVSVFLAVERGPSFALRAAGGAVNGLVGVGCFCAAYALFARRHAWPLALAGALAAFALATLPLRHTAAALPAAAATGAAALALLWSAVTWLTAGAGHAGERGGGGGGGGGAAAPLPGWDLPGRVLLATAVVTLVTGLAGALGSWLSGLASALPVFAAVLGAFTQQREGRGAAIALMRGLLVGCISGMTFFGVVGLLLVPGALGRAYLVAALAAAASGAVVTWLTRPRTALPLPCPALARALRLRPAIPGARGRRPA